MGYIYIYIYRLKCSKNSQYQLFHKGVFSTQEVSISFLQTVYVFIDYTLLYCTRKDSRRSYFQYTFQLLVYSKRKAAEHKLVTSSVSEIRFSCKYVEFTFCQNIQYISLLLIKHQLAQTFLIILALWPYLVEHRGQACVLLQVVTGSILTFTNVELNECNIYQQHLYLTASEL